MITAKVVLIGDSGSGKTSIRNRYFYNRYNDYFKSTIGADFNSKVVHVQDSAVNLMIWDTAGQERFAALSNAFFRGADVAVLVFDASKAPSPDRLKHWYDTFRATCPVYDREIDDFCFIAIGNKIDELDVGDEPLADQHLHTLRLLHPASRQASALNIKPHTLPPPVPIAQTRALDDVRQSVYYTPSSSLNASAVLKEPPLLDIQESLETQDEDDDTVEKNDTDNNDDNKSLTDLCVSDKGFKLFWTSAKTGEGISEVFDYIARFLVYMDTHKQEEMSIDRSRRSTFNIDFHDYPLNRQLFIDDDSISTNSVQFNNNDARKRRKGGGGGGGCC